MSLLKIEGVSKSYDSKSNAIETTNLTINRNERTALVGAAGSGKSTLLKLMAGLEQPDTGDVYFENERIEGPEEKLIPGHASIAYLPQDYRLPNYTRVEEYLLNSDYEDDEVDLVYNACNIHHLLNSFTQHLSGGEKQRVALAKQIMGKPEILLLDEPFSSLDHQHKEIIKSVLEEIEQQLDTTIVLVAHEPVDVLSWANTIIVMKQGAIVQKGTPHTLYRTPKDEYVAGLFGHYNLTSINKWSIPGSIKLTKIENRVLLRPEDFSIGKIGSSDHYGSVTNIKYMGNYYLTELEFDNERILVKSDSDNYQINDRIGVNLSIRV